MCCGPDLWADVTSHQSGSEVEVIFTQWSSSFIFTPSSQSHPKCHSSPQSSKSLMTTSLPCPWWVDVKSRGYDGKWVFCSVCDTCITADHIVCRKHFSRVQWYEENPWYHRQESSAEAPEVWKQFLNAQWPGDIDLIAKCIGDAHEHPLWGSTHRKSSFTIPDPSCGPDPDWGPASMFEWDPSPRLWRCKPCRKQVDENHLQCWRHRRAIEKHIKGKQLWKWNNTKWNNTKWCWNGAPANGAGHYGQSKEDPPTQSHVLDPWPPGWNTDKNCIHDDESQEPSIEPYWSFIHRRWALFNPKTGEVTWHKSRSDE